LYLKGLLLRGRRVREGTGEEGYGKGMGRAVALPERGKGEASPLLVYGKIGRQPIC